MSIIWTLPILCVLSISTSSLSSTLPQPTDSIRNSLNAHYKDHPTTAQLLGRGNQSFTNKAIRVKRGTRICLENVVPVVSIGYPYPYQYQYQQRRCRSRTRPRLHGLPARRPGRNRPGGRLPQQGGNVGKHHGKSRGHAHSHASAHSQGGKAHGHAGGRGHGHGGGGRGGHGVGHGGRG